MLINAEVSNENKEAIPAQIHKFENEEAIPAQIHKFDGTGTDMKHKDEKEPPEITSTLTMPIAKTNCAE